MIVCLLFQKKDNEEWQKSFWNHSEKDRLKNIILMKKMKKGKEKKMVKNKRTQNSLTITLNI